MAESPLATTRMHPDRGRGNTFSPPDTLRDSMALFLQVSALPGFPQLVCNFFVMQCLGQWVTTAGLTSVKALGGLKAVSVG